MNGTTMRRLIPAGAAIAGLVLLAGCSASDGGDDSADGEVTITVAGKPTSERPEELAAFERNLEEFSELHPDITIEGDESQFDVQTFQAQLAGGQLPTVFYVPFTEMQGLIAREQVADLSESIPADSIVNQINPTILDVVQDSDGATFGVPINAYSMGLLYNRDLFVQAGLDPDAPPTSWEEVRAAAKAIEDSTDAQGFASMTIENTGGWVLTTTSYAFGDTLESEDGATATVDNDATKEALEFYQDLRWEDNSFGSNFLLGYGDAMNAFAAGSIGMFVQGADAYGNVVVNLGMSPDAFGLAPLPQQSSGLGTLGGGTAAIVNPTATEAERAAALEWVEFVNFRGFTDEETAVAAAKASSEDGLAVGAPGLPLFNAEVTAQNLEWINEYINVPRENFAAYLETVETLALVPEPATKAQEVYGILDTVVQAVLTREDADIDALLSEAQKTAQAAIDAG